MCSLHSGVGRLFFILITSAELFAQRDHYSNVLNVKNKIIKTDDIEHSCFSDKGAWHAYALPSEKEDYGSFIGPLLMDMQGEWLGNSIAQLHVVENGKELDLSKAKASLNYYPGILQKELETKEIKIERKLIFSSSRESEIQTIITNITDQKLSIKSSWSGKILSHSARLTATERGFDVYFINNNHLFSLSTSYTNKNGIKISDNSYQTHKKTISLELGIRAGLASTKQADAVKSFMENPDKFNTFIPLPTFTADHPKFNPMKGYWRGPVWLDQFYFGIEGLRRYKYTTLADELVNKLMKNAEGLNDNRPIRENYHPLTGEGLNATNFSWSASHILMLLKK